MAGPLQLGRRLAANAGRALRRGLGRAALPRRQGFWVRVRLAPPLGELRVPSWPFAGELPQSLLDVLETLEAAACDPQVNGVLLWLAGGPRGWSRVQAVRRAVERVREAGKPVVAYADSLEAEDLLIASAASRIFVPETGSVFLIGLRFESLFLRGLATRLAVRPEILRVGTHKTAGEMFTRDAMSPEQREQMEALLDDLFQELVGGIAAGRNLAPKEVRQLVDRGPFRAPEALAAGLIDACLYPDELEAELEKLSPIPPKDPAPAGQGREAAAQRKAEGRAASRRRAKAGPCQTGAAERRRAPARPGPRRVQLVEAPVFHALRARDPGWRPLLSDLPRIAYVVASGAIHRGTGMRGIASERVQEMLEHIRRDEGVRGVVLRLDSPGGDGLASDLIWRAVARLGREKPVVVSMADVAASGGYYLATAADAIFAEAGTITGSIGVVGGKVNLGGLYERLGVSKQGVERGARAGMLSETRGFTPGERSAMRSQLQAVYDIFVDRVAEGRGLTAERVNQIAQGRVWSGSRAQSLGLVDALGGPLEALREVRRRAGLAEDARFLLDLHPRHPRLPSLRTLAGLIARIVAG